MNPEQTPAVKELSGREATFGPFRVIPSRRLLLCGDKQVRLGEPAYNVLLVLIEHAGETVDRETLIVRAWGSAFIEESNLRTAIAALRRALNEADPTRPYIATVARGGYRFVEPVAFIDLSTTQRGIPLQLARIVGRDAFVADLVEDISQHRLITVVGPGGIGKTTAAQGAARRALSEGSAESVHVIGLETAEDPKLLPSTFRAGLGIVAKSNDPMSDIISFLGKRRILIVLDGCERMIGAIASLAEQVLAFAPSSIVLATSREPLRADGEWIRRLDPLLVPPSSEPLSASDALSFAAVELFVDRATSSHPGFHLTDETAPMVVEICRRLDGVPLAIEVAAARMDSFDLPVLADVLGGHFRLQMLGRSTALPRHRTLAATLDWSFDALSEREQTVFRRLSVFRGPFSFEAARQIVAWDSILAADVSSLIAGLVGKSLVTVGDERMQGKHRLLDTTRAYARDKLDQSGERDVISRRHAIYYGAMLVEAKKRNDLIWTVDWDHAYGGELDQIRAALDWSSSPSCDPELALTLALDALSLWGHLGLEEERLAQVDRVEALPGFTSRKPRAKSHDLVVQIASERLREDGIDGVNIADLMNEAGLTLGGFYKHFNSREALIVEALGSVMGGLEKRINQEAELGKTMTFADATAEYLSQEHRDNPGKGCAVSALISEVGRCGERTRSLYTKQIRRDIELIAGMLGGESSPATRARAVLLYSAWVGAMGLARAVSDDQFADEILDSVKELLVEHAEIKS